jgi:hypothetical protein
MSVIAAFLLAVVQDDAAEMKWSFGKDDVFDLKYSYQEQRKGENGAGDRRTVLDGHDKREVDAELTYKEDGVLLLTLKKVSWQYGTPEYDLTLVYVDGKPVGAALKMKPPPKDLSDVKEAAAAMYATAKLQGEALLEQFKKIGEGEYTVMTAAQRGETVFSRTGASTIGRLGLFDRIFTHGVLPQGSVKKDQVWKDPLESILIPAGTLDAKPALEHKVTGLSGKEITVKAGLSLPVSKPPVAGSTMTMTGSLAYSREWTFSRAEHLAGAKEEMTFVKKVDAKGKEADFYKSNLSHKVTQTLKITKRASAEPKNP